MQFCAFDRCRYAVMYDRVVPFIKTFSASVCQLYLTKSCFVPTLTLEVDKGMCSDLFVSCINRKYDLVVKMEYINFIGALLTISALDKNSKMKTLYLRVSLAGFFVLPNLYDV